MRFMCILCAVLLAGKSQTLNAQNRVESSGTGPAKRTGVVDGLVCTGVLRGRVFDVNHVMVESSQGRAAVLPMALDNTTWTRGNFQLSWSEQWYPNGGSVRIMVNDSENNQAAIVSVENPNVAIDIILKPAHQITGRVVDVDGHGKADLPLIISLASNYRKNNLPIDCIRTDRKGRFHTLSLPTDQTYQVHLAYPHSVSFQLFCETSEYKAGTLKLNESSEPQIDLGDVFCLRKPKSQKPGHDMNSDWLEAFQSMYCLRPGENLKFIKAPFMPERHDYFLRWMYLETSHSLTREPTNWTKWLWEDGRLLQHGTISCPPMRPFYPLDLFMKYVLKIEAVDSTAIWRLKLPRGEWIVRKDISEEEKLRAFEDIVFSEFRDKIYFEKRPTGNDGQFEGAPSHIWVLTFEKSESGKRTPPKILY